MILAYIHLWSAINFTHVLCAGATRGRSHTMSGILKRKLEEGPPPYLSLQGSDDDEVSCSDSGNSSDSLNHPVPSGLLDCKITLPRCSCRQLQLVCFGTMETRKVTCKQHFFSVILTRTLRWNQLKQRQKRQQLCLRTNMVTVGIIWGFLCITTGT